MLNQSITEGLDQSDQSKVIERIMPQMLAT
jgi:hypothetical protein